jgi:hypothetical protein
MDMVVVVALAALRVLILLAAVALVWLGLAVMPLAQLLELRAQMAVLLAGQVAMAFLIQI